MYTTEQIESMAACLRDIARYYIDEGSGPGPWQAMVRDGVLVPGFDGHILAPWLAPPDDSVALDHPMAMGALGLERLDGQYRYVQWVKIGLENQRLCIDWHDTEEAARREWNAICRRAAK